MAQEDYERLVELARSDDRVLGLVLTGSRGRGPYARPDSDWDVRLVVLDEALDEARAAYATGHGAPVETVVFALSGFETAGEIGSPNEWDRYSYAHALVVLDKLGGRIAELVAEKGVLPSGKSRDIAAAALDGYINSYYRSAKNLGNGLAVEAHFDAAESVSPFLTALFAMHTRSTIQQVPPLGTGGASARGSGLGRGGPAQTTPGHHEHWRPRRTAATLP